MEAALRHYTDDQNQDEQPGPLRRCGKHARRIIDSQWLRSDQALYDQWLSRDEPESTTNDVRESLDLERLSATWVRAITEQRRGLRCLNEAREALNGIDDESRREGFDLCSQAAKATAIRVLEALCFRFPRDYDVYPTADREVAIAASGGHRRNVLILCEPDGGATFYVVMAGSKIGAKRRAHYDGVGKLPGAFLTEAMQELEQG